MTAGSLTWTTNGSYGSKRAQDLSGVGWIIFCNTTGWTITGSFWERSLMANSFRAEMLDLCTLHLLAWAIAEYYGVERWSSTMCCYNKRALLLSSHHKRRIRPSAKYADIRRNVHATKLAYQGRFKYVHVYGHMDQHLSWAQLSLPQQLKCVCDTLIKRAVTTAIIKGYHNGPTSILAWEDVALIVWGDKITGNILGPLRFHASKSVTHKYLMHQRKKNKWTHDQFEEVDWEHLDLALKLRADNYRIWRSKQTPSFCGARVQVGLY
jgi:hypothetical protein